MATELVSGLVGDHYYGKIDDQKVPKDCVVITKTMAQKQVELAGQKVSLLPGSMELPLNKTDS